MSRWIARIGILLLLAYSIVQYVVYDALLPERIAVHFNGQGKPDGWQTRQEFWVFSFAMVYGTWLFFAGIGQAIKFLPSSMINIPKKDYWLDPVRKKATMQRLGGGLEVFATIQAAWMVWLFDSLVHINIERSQLGSLFIIQLIVYLAATAVWLTWYIVGFRRPQEVR